jgi:hypothetical protein
MTTDPPETTVEQLLDDASTLDCALRLRQPAWAAETADRLAARLARHGEEALHAWHGVDEAAGEALAAEASAVRTAVLAVATMLRRAGSCSWPPPDVYQQVAALIHREVLAVADTAWPLDD